MCNAKGVKARNISNGMNFASRLQNLDYLGSANFETVKTIGLGKAIFMARNAALLRDTCDLLTKVNDKATTAALK